MMTIDGPVLPVGGMTWAQEAERRAQAEGERRERCTPALCARPRRCTGFYRVLSALDLPSSLSPSRSRALSLSYSSCLSLLSYSYFSLSFTLSPPLPPFQGKWQEGDGSRWGKGGGKLAQLISQLLSPGPPPSSPALADLFLLTMVVRSIAARWYRINARE